eukprot:4773489-Prymnesium_polylepis.1
MPAVQPLQLQASELGRRTYGANRDATPFAAELVKQFKEIGFDATLRIDHTGTYPLLKAIHAWSWQKVCLELEDKKVAAFKQTRFLYTRPDKIHMDEIADASIEQGVFSWLTAEDLPLCEAGISFLDAFALFHTKLKRPGLLVATAEAVKEVKENQPGILIASLSTANLTVPWCESSTEYHLLKVDPPSSTTTPTTPAPQKRLAQGTPKTSIHGSRQPKSRSGATQTTATGAADSADNGNIAPLPQINWADVARYDDCPKSAGQVKEARERAKRDEAAAKGAAAETARKEALEKEALEKDRKSVKSVLRQLVKTLREGAKLAAQGDKLPVPRRQDHYRQLKDAIEGACRIRKDLQATGTWAQDVDEIVKSCYSRYYKAAIQMFRQLEEKYHPDDALRRVLRKLLRTKAIECGVDLRTKAIECGVNQQHLDAAERLLQSVSVDKLIGVGRQLRELKSRLGDDVQ